jgi:hypothetical protein
MRALPLFLYVAAGILLSSCAEQPSPPPPPTPPAHPALDGNVQSVCPRDIRIAIALVKKKFLKYGRPQFSIYRVHITDHNHIEVSYRPPDVVEECQPLERINGTWKTTETERVIITGRNIPTG